MADVKAVCPGCGKSVTISEFADVLATVCRTCGGSLQREGVEEGGAPAAAAPQLSVLRRGPGEAVNLRGETIAPKPEFTLTERVIPNSVIEEEKAKARPAHPVIGVFVFLLAALLMVGPQAIGDRYPEVLALYLQVRLGVLALVWLLVAIEAWSEGMGHGLLSTFFPPYVIFYALGRSERVWLRSLTLAAVLMLVAELHFLGSDSLVRQGQASVDRGIRSVENLLQRAGDPTP